MFEEGKKLVESKKDININNLQDEENYQLYNVAYYDGKKFVQVLERCNNMGWWNKKKNMIYLKNIEMIWGKDTGWNRKCY